LSRLSKVEFQHIGYRGTAAAIPDLLGGQLPSMVSPLGEFLKYIPDGKIRVLATSGSKRSGFTPQIGTFSEQGFKDLEVQEYYGFYLPAKSSSAQVQALNAAIRQAMSQPQVKEALDTFGMEAAPSSPEELTTILRNYSKRWEAVVKAIGFKAD
jgi:tripartite-type tricarboxylate transporter receptor subunit TctC